MNLSNVGIENRLFAAITFEKRVFDGERISYLTVLSVRKRYRGLKLGQFLVQLVIKLAGNRDPLIVLGDDDALEFFGKQGFINDPMICAKYEELKREGNWTNCSVLVRLPKIIPEVKTGIQEMSIENIEKIVEEKVEKWQRDSYNLYQQQVSLVSQLKKEIVTGREKIKEQQLLIKKLTEELNKQYDNNHENQKTSSRSKVAEIAQSDMTAIQAQIEKLNLDSVIKEYEQITTRRSVAPQVSNRGDKYPSNEYIVVTPGTPENVHPNEDSSSGKINMLSGPEFSISDESRQINRAELIQNHDLLEKNYNRIIEMFKSSLKNSNPELFQQVKVINVHLIDNQNVKSREISSHGWSEMFYSGSLLSTSDLNGIREKGRFNNFNFTYGDYGIGLYFSRFAEVSIRFSKVNCIIVASVNPGCTNSTLKVDSSRRNAGSNFDSLLTPGRLSELSSPRQKEASSLKEKYQEMIIFDPRRAFPEFVIEYILI